MPIYEYECQKCGERIEVMQRMSEDPLEECSKKPTKGKKKACGGELKKLISSTSFSLKGGGWAKDGYSG